MSRGRKAKKSTKSARRPATTSAPATLEPCDCPACSGADLDLPAMVDDLLADVDDVAESADPLDAELVAASFMAICEMAGDGYEDALADGFVPEFEAQASTSALTLLRAIGSVAAGRAGKAAAAAADRLADAGVPLPGWLAELAEPVTAGDCWRLVDAQGTASMLVCSLHRAGRAHAVMVNVDHTHCDSATDVVLLDANDLPQALQMIEVQGRDGGFAIMKERLDPAEFRWQVENALDSRAVHDQQDSRLRLGRPPANDDDLPDYRALAVLVRSRTRWLPDSGKAKAPHRDSLPRTALPRILGAPARKRPAKPTARSGRAPVFQIKVGLRDAKPPIWRRLEVPADVSLARLHLIIQVAFGWDDSHLHVFETPYGDFGISDPELGHRPADSVSLAQVLPGVRDKITYTYDFGDNWRHDIVVEKVLEPDRSVSYPRCTGGRRAAPPEDCGGVWGYSYLLDALTNPSHPEHEERLEWLGLDSAAELDPAAFDAAAVTRALSSLR